MKSILNFLSKLLIFFCLSKPILNTLQFELRTDHQRCYVEELFQGSVAIIKYKIVGLPTDDIVKTASILQNIHFNISLEYQSQILHRETAKERKSKFSYHSTSEGHYK